MKLAEFNDADRAAAKAVLRPCIDVQRWVDQIADARPFASVGELLDGARKAAAPFTAEEIESALAHHPRIGERPPPKPPKRPCPARNSPASTRRTPL